MTEEQAAGVRRADPDALSSVYRTFCGPLLAWATSQVGGDRTAAEDVVEETFLELVRDCEQIEGGADAVRAWLYRTARHNVLDWARTRGRDRADVHPEVPEMPDGAADLADAVSAEDAAARLRRAVDALPAAQREVVTLRYLAELDTAEVAAITGRSQVAVRGLLHRGLTRLRQAEVRGALGADDGSVRR